MVSTTLVVCNGLVMSETVYWAAQHDVLMGIKCAMWFCQQQTVYCQPVMLCASALWFQVMQAVSYSCIVH